MREEQFIELPSQGSIYSVTRLGNILIVGSGNYGKIFSYSSAKNLEEMTLPDLPNDIEIVALDSFQDTYPVLAVSFVHKAGGNEGDDKPKGGLHIYSANASQPDSPSYSSPEGFSSKSFSPKARVKDHVDSSQFDLIGQHLSRVRLDYIPFDLFHVPVRMDNDSYGHIFLLTGSDRRIHAFQPGEDKNSFIEVPVGKYFPELSGEFESIVTRVHVECLNERTKRISLCGCEDGTLHIWVVKSENLHSHSQGFDASLETTKSKGNGDFELPDGDTIEKTEHNYDGLITSIQSFTDGFQFNVVVASACSPTYIYTNTIEDRFTTGVPLKFSSRWDTVEAVCVADIDLDGRAEIILGTFGCTMLVYKYMDDILPQWVIVAHKKFSSGILSITTDSSSHQTANNIIHVVTASGIHVIEYSTSAYFQKFSNTITSTIPEEDSRNPNDSLTDKPDD